MFNGIVLLRRLRNVTLRKIFALTLVAGSVAAAFADTAANTRSAVKPADRPHLEFKAEPAWPEPPAATTSISGVVTAFYDAISAGPNERLDRTRLRSLFTPDGRIAYLESTKNGNPSDVVFLTPDQYADGYDHAPDPKHSPQGFYDEVIANQIERFGNMAHVWGAYQSRHSRNDPKPFVRGIKSLDLLQRNGHWYILQVYFAHEDGNYTIAAKYLHNHSM